MNIITKRCSKCKREFPATLEYFQSQKSKSRKDGLHSWCKECKQADQRKHNKRYYANNREKVIESSKEQARKNPEQQKARHKKWYLANKELSNERSKDSQRKDRLTVLAAYGGKCVCCGETRFEFLAIDHINGGGRKHRLSIPSGKVYRWLKKQNYPKDGFQVLCHNCNMAKAFYRICPHQK